VIGQEEAISVIASAIRRSVRGFPPPDGRGSFVFLGHGRGKTLVAKTLAEFLFGDEEALVRIDMSDFMRSIMSPPSRSASVTLGTRKADSSRRRSAGRPFSVILLDEIEKAHPDVFNISSSAGGRPALRQPRHAYRSAIRSS